MANYDLTYEGSRVQGILDTGNSLKDAGYIFRGEATPSTVPGTPTERVAYIGGPGTYTNFGGSITVGAGCICVFKYTGSAWSNQVINTGLDSAVNTLQSAITAINNNIGNGYVYAGVATPSTSPITGKVFYLAVQAGTYTNFGSAVVTAGLNVIKYNGSVWSVDQVIAIDAEPTQGSANLVKSGGVLNSIIQNGPAFDISAYNAQGGTLATYADLSAALTALNTLPADFKKGGMSVKFVQTSDNKYVQWRLMADDWSTTISDWQGVDNVPTAGSENLVKSGGVKEDINKITGFSITVESTGFYVAAELPSVVKAGTILSDIDGLFNNLYFCGSGGDDDIFPIPAVNKNTLPYTLDRDAYKIKVDATGTFVLKFQGSLNELDEKLSKEIEDIYMKPFISGLPKGSEEQKSFIKQFFIYDPNNHIGDNENIFISLITRNNDVFGWSLFIQNSLGNLWTMTHIENNLLNPPFAENKPFIAQGQTGSDITIFADLDWSVFEDGINTGGDLHISLNVKECKNPYNSPSLYFHNGELSIVSDKIANINSQSIGIEIDCPDTIYAVVGDTLQIFYEDLFNCHNIEDYEITAICTKGKSYPRYFEYTPQAGDTGTTTIQFNAYRITEPSNSLGSLVCTKNVNLITVAKLTSFVNPYNVLCVGDSTTEQGQWPRELARRIYADNGTPQGLGISNLNFVGRKTDIVAGKLCGWEGTGGWSWDTYLSGVEAFRLQVTGVTTLELGAVYSSTNGALYRIEEINVTSGSGNIRLTYWDSPVHADLPSSGILTKVQGGGDNTIEFTSWVSENYSPFYVNGQVDFSTYANEYCDGHIDSLIVFLGINSIAGYHADLQTHITGIINNAKTFIDAFHADFPNAKVILMCPPNCSLIGGMADNYGASLVADFGMYNRQTYQLMKAYIELGEDTSYSSFVHICNNHAEFDALYGYPYNEVPVNARTTNITERRGTNGVHPNNSGYYMLADSAYRMLSGIINP